MATEVTEVEVKVETPVNEDTEPENQQSNEDEVIEKPKKKTAVEEKSGVRRRFKINVPGIINTDKSSKKPPTYKWAQQQLPACRPVYNGLHVFVIFTIIGVIFVILGGVFLGININLKEYRTTYTNCNTTAFVNDSVNGSCELLGNEEDFPTCADYVSNISRFGRDQRNNMNLCLCYCEVTIDIEEDMTSPVYVYYELNNYYQNHRRFVNSWSPRSLRADDITDERTDCDPLRRSNGSTIFPCGLIANSFFNDTLWISGLDVSQENIAWETDRETRFKNPSEDDRENTVLPPNWLRYIDNGQRNESYMVWFRVSAFPNFRKLLGRVENDTISAGTYTLNVVYNYPVVEFNGGKHFVISEVSWLGTRNLFLGIDYIIMGGLSIIMGVVLLVVHFIFSKWKTSDKNFLQREY